MLKLEQPGSSSSNSSSSDAAAIQAGKQQPVDPQLGELLLDVQAGLAKTVRGAAAAGDSIQVGHLMCASYKAESSTYVLFGSMHSTAVGCVRSNCSLVSQGL
jgi:hypothetical protein